jgi:alkylation response protein AidB-like acyl-CoA dehydrogenase
LQSEVALRAMLKTNSSAMSPSQRAELARCVIDACATRALAYKHLMTYADDTAPGPEGSLDKLLWSESFQRLCSLATAVVGVEAALGERNQKVGAVLHRYLYSRGRTIAAGTSEIQRSIIAERLLGLPRSL